MISRFQQVQTQDRNLNQVQQNLAKSINPLFANPLINGILIPDVILTTGDNYIEHKLGRALIGWIIVRRSDGTSAVFDKQQTLSEVLQQTQLLLNSSGSVQVTLYVF
jgi:hypothetical protein